jgi:hypothetical protein
MFMRIVLCLTGFMVLGFSVAAQNQVKEDPFHYLDKYDSTEKVTLRGKINRLDWTNPLVHIYLDVTDGEGKVTAWSLVGYPPNTLKRSGLTSDLLPQGQTITVTAFRSKDGSNTAAVSQIVFSDGSMKLAGPAARIR